MMKKILMIGFCVLFSCSVYGIDIGISPQGDVKTLGKETNKWQRIDVETSSLSPLGYAKGDAPYYLTTTSVAFSNGSFFANGKYAVVTNQVYTFTSLAAAQDFHYVYNDFSASTYPSNLVFYDVTTEPTQRVDQGGGWYNSTSINDRVWAALLSTNGAVELYQFATAGEYIGLTQPINFALNINPDNTWQEPNVDNLDNLTPLNVRTVRITAKGQDVNAPCGCTVTTTELANLGGTPLLLGQPARGEIGGTGWHQVHHTGEMSLGKSRQVKVAGGGDDDNVLAAWFNGFTIEQ